MSSENTKKVNVGDLRVGMYVCKLDRDWLDTPFLLQGFHIEEEEDIDIIGEYCDYVWIDDDKTIQKFSPFSSNVGTAAQIRPRTDPLDYEVPLAEEHRRVMGTFRQARNLTKTLLDDIRNSADTAMVMVNGRLFDVDNDMAEIGGRNAPAPEFYWQRHGAAAATAAGIVAPSEASRHWPSMCR